MIWLVPAAWLGALAIAVPILVHLVARPRAAVQPFPTLRFLLGGARAARRRRRVENWPLLAVRCAIVALAVAALSGPLVVTEARRAAWNARVFTETVGAPDGSIRDGLARAVATLGDAPPGRRAIVVRSTFPAGSITDADIAAVPSSIGLTFERTGAPPSRREIDAPVLVRSALAGRSTASAERLSRSVVVDLTRTAVFEGETTSELPIDFLVPPAARTTLEAVLAERVPVLPQGRRATLLIVESSGTDSGGEAPIRTPWIADAAARIARDQDLRLAARQLTAALPTGAFNREPWQVVAEDRDGHAMAAASSDASDRLVVATASGPHELATAVLIRATLNAMALSRSFESVEVMTISDTQLRAWSREPGPAVPPRHDTADDDDRRALWIGVLVLLGVETWMRRQTR